VTAPTTPGLDQLTPAEAIALLNLHATAALELERAASQAVAAPVHGASSALMRWAAQQWVRRYGDLGARIEPDQWAKLRHDTQRRLALTEPRVARDAVLEHSRRGLQLGTGQGAVELRVAPVPVRDLSGAIEGYGLLAEAAVGARYQDSKTLLRTMPVQSHAQLVTALAPTKTAGSDVDRITRTAVNAAVNQGLADVADEHDASLLWFAERDACVVCLALAGSVVAVDDDFDDLATFGERVLSWWQAEDDDGPLRPPRHPNCRCRCEPWRGDSGLPEALAREAQRSILRGWRTGSEPERVRIRAAAALLERGSSLPRSVQDRARNAIRAGAFTVTAPADVPRETAK
jgi:hypothetical protein